jgi:hypothetical protein
MHALFSGHNNVNVVEATESEIHALMPDESRGCFDYTWEYSIEGDDLTVNFTPNILINKALNRDEHRDAESHERRHFEDFRRLANELKENLKQFLEAGRDHQIDLWMEWFDYDNCIAKQRRHVSEGITDYYTCIMPFNPGPR